MWDEKHTRWDNVLVIVKEKISKHRERAILNNPRLNIEKSNFNKRKWSMCKN